MVVKASGGQFGGHLQGHFPRAGGLIIREGGDGLGQGLILAFHEGVGGIVTHVRVVGSD